jgi:hypothetical protein
MFRVVANVTGLFVTCAKVAAVVSEVEDMATDNELKLPKLSAASVVPVKIVLADVTVTDLIFDILNELVLAALIILSTLQ